MPLKIGNISTSHPALARAVARFNAFLDWWVKNLTECLPGTWRRNLPKQNARTRILIGRQKTAVSVDGAGWVPYVPSQTEDMLPPRVGDRADIVIEDDATLVRTIVLPREVMNDLSGAVAFQLKQHVPMEEGSIAVGYAVEDKGSSQGIHLTIGAVRTGTIDRAFEVAKSLGYVPQAFKTALGDLSLSVPQLIRSTQLRRLVVISGVGVLFIQFMVLPSLDSRRVRAANEALKTELNDLVGKTKSAADLKRAVDQRVSDSALLNSQMSQDVFADGLALISAHAPNDVWLSEVQYDGKVFRITGTAGDPAAWALKLQQTDVFENVRLEGVSGAAQSENGRFQVNLQIRGRGGEK